MTTTVEVVTDLKDEEGKTDEQKDKQQEISLTVTVHKKGRSVNDADKVGVHLSLYCPLLTLASLYGPLLILASLYGPLLILMSLYSSLLILASFNGPLLILTSLYDPLLILASLYDPLLILASLYYLLLILASLYDPLRQKRLIINIGNSVLYILIAYICVPIKKRRV